MDSQGQALRPAAVGVQVDAGGIELDPAPARDAGAEPEPLAQSPRPAAAAPDAAAARRVAELEREVLELRARLGAQRPPAPPAPTAPPPRIALESLNENALQQHEALLARRLGEVREARRLQQARQQNPPAPELPPAGQPSPCPIPLLVLAADVPARYRWLARAHCAAAHATCLLTVALSVASLLGDSPWQRCLAAGGDQPCLDPTLAGAVPLALAGHEAAVFTVVLLWRLAWPPGSARGGAASRWDALPLLRVAEGARANAWAVEGTPPGGVLPALLRRERLRLALLPGLLLVFSALAAGLTASYGAPVLPAHAAVAARAAVAAAGAALAWALPGVLRAQWAAEFGEERGRGRSDAAGGGGGGDDAAGGGGGDGSGRCSELVPSALEFDPRRGGARELAEDLLEGYQRLGRGVRVRLRYLGSAGAVHVVALSDCARWLAAGQLTGGLGVAAAGGGAGAGAGAGAAPPVGLPVEVMPLVGADSAYASGSFQWLPLPHPLLVHWGRPAAPWQPLPCAAQPPEL